MLLEIGLMDKVSKNFSQEEFDSKDGAVMPSGILENIKLLAKELQVLRDYTGLPITINSGYRSLEHNANIGGVRKSKHTKGLAADIVVKGMKAESVYNLIDYLISTGAMKQGGLGKYPNFTHYDIYFDGENIRRWDNT